MRENRVFEERSISALPCRAVRRFEALPEASCKTGCIPLQLRNQAELEARVQRGEIIPADELQAKYFPLESDLDAVAAWLAGGRGVHRR